MPADKKGRLADEIAKEYKAKKSGESEKDDDEDKDEASDEDAIAQEVLDAIEEGSASELAKALRAFVKTCASGEDD